MRTLKLSVQMQSGAAPDADILFQTQPTSLLLLGNALNLGVARRIRELSPQTKIFLRWAGDGDWSFAPEYAPRFLDNASRAFMPFLAAGLCDGVLTPNEPVIRTSDEAMQLNESWVSICAGFRRRGFDFIIGPNFSVGNPRCRFFDGEATLWPYLQEAVRASDVLSLHEYSAPRMIDGLGAYCLRYRHVRDELRTLGATTRNADDILIAITECGIDRGVLAGELGGYRHPDNPLTISDYIDDLKWYAGELARDPYVQFAHVFLYGASDGRWATFDVADDENDRAQFLAFMRWNPQVRQSPVLVRPQPPTGAKMITPSDITDAIPFLVKKALKAGLGQSLYGEFPVRTPGHLYYLWVFEHGGVGTESGHYADEDGFFFDPVSGAISLTPPTPPPAPQPIPTPPVGPAPFIFPQALKDIGAVGHEGSPVVGQKFYRLTAASVIEGVSAFCQVNVYGRNGIPGVGVQVVNLRPDGRGEIIQTDAAGRVQFSFGHGSQFYTPGEGPFKIYLAVGAIKDDDTKLVTQTSIISDRAASLGDWQGSHTEIYLQFVEQ